MLFVSPAAERWKFGSILICNYLKLPMVIAIQRIRINICTFTSALRVDIDLTHFHFPNFITGIKKWNKLWYGNRLSITRTFDKADQVSIINRSLFVK